jgi:coproporphyrinogen III oxidase-like Fe-S oxidoreductase
MRLREGVPVSRLEEEGGAKIEQLLDLQKIKALQGEGLLTFDSDVLAATDQGLQRLNGVLSYLL